MVIVKPEKVLRGVGKAALCIVGVAVAYAAIGMALSLIPVNGNAVPGGDVVVFYEGTGRYSPVFICNTWANSALKACGQKCCLWTFLPHPIFWKYRQAGAGHA